MYQEHEEKGFSESAGSSSRPRDENVTSKGNSLEKLGEILWEEGDLRQAKLMFEKARNGFEEFYGPSHHDTLRLALLVGMISCITGTKDQATEMLQWVNAGQESLHMLHRAVLKNNWIRYQKILQNEHKRAWKTYLEIKESLDINLF